MNFPANYPNVPPKCQIITTDNSHVRFNPNLYAAGKVCLSILGTWRGESADEWRSTYSILYVLQAIQALIMNSTPFHNEPGYETVFLFFFFFYLLLLLLLFLLLLLLLFVFSYGKFIGT